METLNPEYKRELLRALEYHFPGAKIYLFGSRATGKAHSRSDIDLAIDQGKRIPINEITRALITIEYLDIPYRVDLVDMHSAPAELLIYIERDKIPWKE